MTKYNPHTKFRDFQSRCARALLGGGTWTSRTRIEWGLSGNCSSPLEVVRHERPSADINVVHAEDLFRKKKVATRNVRVAPGTPIPLELTYRVRCGTCENCVRAKRYVLARNTLSELMATMARGAQAWFVTLTISPDKLYAFKGLAEREWVVREGFEPSAPVGGAQDQISYWNMRQLSTDRLPQRLKEKYLDRVIYREIQMYLKRLRAGRVNSKRVKVEREIPPAAFGIHV